MPVSRRRIDRTRQSDASFPIRGGEMNLQTQFCTTDHDGTNASFASTSPSATSLLSAADGDAVAGEKKQGKGSASEEEQESHKQDPSSPSSSLSDVEERGKNAKIIKRRKSLKRPSPSRGTQKPPGKAKKQQIRPNSKRNPPEAEFSDDAQEDDSGDEGSRYSFQDDSHDEDYHEGQEDDGDDEYEDEDNDLVDESADDKPPARGAARKRSRSGSGRRRTASNKADESSESEFAVESSSSTSESSLSRTDEDPRNGRRRSNDRSRDGNNQSTKRKVSRPGKLKKDDSDDDSSSAYSFEDDESDFGRPSPRRKGGSAVRKPDASAVAPRRNSKGGKKALDDTSEEERSGSSPKRPPGRPLSRKVTISARKPIDRRLTKADSEGEDSNLNLSSSPVHVKTKRHRLERLSASRRKRRHKRRGSVQKVRDQDIGDSEESSSSGNRRTRAVTQEGGVFEDSEDASQSSSVDVTGLATANMDSPQRGEVACPSTTDVITEEDLPAKHVCFCTPDGSRRYCFALETLRQIALTSADPKIDAEGKPTFLQPLHFRTAMSDDLVDQIASRFGRGALDINGSFYNRTAVTAEGITFNPPSHSSVYEANSFRRRVGRFVRTVMGNRHLYVCPLCYTVAYNRMKESRDGAAARRGQKGVAKGYATDFQEDPMYILGWPDDDDFRVAATFCFKKAKDVENHLRHDHHVFPKKTRSEIYARYSIRKSDGLVQRFVRSIGGNVKHYWLEGGYNFDFVYLSQQSDTAAACRLTERTSGDEEYDPDELEEATDFLEDGRQFFESFRKDAKDLWGILSAPYSTRNDIGDFVVEDGAEEEDPEGARMAHLVFSRQDMDEEMEKDREYVEWLERKGEGNIDEEDDGDDCDGAARCEGSDEDLEGSSHRKEVDAASSASEDDWMAKKRKSLQERRAKGRNQQSKRIADEQSSLSGRSATASERGDSDDPPVRSKSSSTIRKRKSIQDSDDD